MPQQELLTALIEYLNFVLMELYNVQIFLLLKLALLPQNTSIILDFYTYLQVSCLKLCWHNCLVPIIMLITCMMSSF